VSYRSVLLAIGAALFVAACSTASGTDSTESPADTAPPATSTSLTLPPVASLPPDTTTCAFFGQIEALGTVTEPELTETSGIATSRRHDGVIWAHNDSRNDAAVFATGRDGAALGRFDLDGVRQLDWEDMAIGPGPDPALDYLYIGDIGDNLAFRPEVILLRVAEPDPASGGGTITGVERFGLVYPTPGINAEALAVDPITGDIIIVSKDPTGVAIVYWAPAEELTSGGLTALRQIATLDLGAEVSGADISVAGDMVALRGYREIWVWPRFDLDLGVTLAATPCRAAAPDEVQGEAIAFDPSGLGLYTISEGSGPAVNFVSGRS
jgi:hypothetical protein